MERRLRGRKGRPLWINNWECRKEIEAREGWDDDVKAIWLFSCILWVGSQLLAAGLNE